ncbi:hypothetical protein O6H91_03G007900 [Diphasiastrum complanatum]|uniref:Uncharacterized protein n=1 Tax=Diphasiastrum complanatum TaxID=34168 RepID=A0ACC2E3A7_DIPCM|nr:hypothetical protein O6H91_03G007900 [Diphasiastrum complanatum]
MCQPNKISNIDGPKDIVYYEQYIRYTELQVFSRPLIPSREFYFLRYCKQHVEGMWAVVDVFVDVLRDSPPPSLVMRCHRRPSGYLIQDMANDCSKIYSELQVLSHPLIPTREFYFLRYCKQHVEGMWAVVDMFIDVLRDSPPPSLVLMRCRRRPSRYLIQDIANDCSKVSHAKQFFVRCLYVALCTLIYTSANQLLETSTNLSFLYNNPDHSNVSYATCSYNFNIFGYLNHQY